MRIGEIRTSNFSFSHNVFHSYTSLVRQNAVLCGNKLTLSQTTNFRLSQTGRVCRQKLLNLMKMVASSPKG